jgi:fermentation-respiration switch protein FrsA (DUF1100 family)
MPVQWKYVIGLIIILAAALYLFYPKIENLLVFFPQSDFDLTPEELHLPYQDVNFYAADGVSLHGWFFRNEPAACPVILFCHGNAGNISHRLDNVGRLLEAGLRVFIFDYRGYGKSAGRPSEEGLYRDGLAAYDYLIREAGVSPKEVVLFGRSLGAAVAVEVALKRELKALILESAFTSTKDMAGSMFLFRVLSPLLPAHYNNVAKIGRVSVPKLFIHGDADGIVPFSMGKRLYDAAAEPKRFLRLKGAGHNDTYVAGGEKYFRVLKAFAEESA